MRYFFYEQHRGKLTPAATAEHPKSGLHKPRIIGQIHELKEGESNLSLNQLSAIYPKPEGYE